MDIIPGGNALSSAMTAEKIKLQLAVENIANANNTRAENGKAYKRKQAVFEAHLDKSSNKSAPISVVRFKGIVEDQTPGQKIYDPSHPHADDSGMVEQSNVQRAREMVDMMTASNSNEANFRAFQMSKNMTKRAINLGKQ